MSMDFFSEFFVIWEKSTIEICNLIDDIQLKIVAGPNIRNSIAKVLSNDRFLRSFERILCRQNNKVVLHAFGKKWA